MMLYAVIIVLVVGIILIILAEKKFKELVAKEKQQRQEVYYKYGFTQVDENYKPYINKSIIIERFKQDNYYVQECSEVFKSDDSDAMQVYAMKVNESSDTDYSGIFGTLIIKKTNISISNPLWFHFDMDSYEIEKTDYLVDYDEWLSNEPCRIDIEAQQNDFDDSHEELKNAYVTKEEAVFKSKCAELVEKFKTRFMFYCDNDVLEVFVEDNSNLIEKFNKDSLNEIVENDIKNQIAIVDDIYALIKSSKL